MAYSFTTNTTPGTGTVAMWSLITTLVTAGWTVKADSDGSTYNSAGGQVTGSGAGAHGLNNTNAWVELEAPAVNGFTRRIVIQRGTTTRLWRIKSALARFTGGTPGISQVGSGTNEFVMVGTGSDAAPVGTSIFAVDGTFRFHVACGGATELYSFVAWGLLTGTTTGSCMIMMDVLASASSSPADVDPAVYYVATATSTVMTEIVVSSSVATSATAGSAGFARAWLGALATASNNVGVVLATIGSTIIGSGATLGSNPFSGKDDMIVALWVRCAASVAPVGLKGFSTLLRWATVVKTAMVPFDVVTTSDRVWFNGGVTLPWDGSAPLI